MPPIADPATNWYARLRQVSKMPHCTSALTRRSLAAAVAISASWAASAAAEEVGSDWPVTPRGRVTITAAAVARLQALLDKLHGATPGSSWIASIIWTTERGYKNKEDDEWHYTGPGLEIGFYARDQVPRRSVENFSGVDVVFVYPDNQFSIFDGKTIDFTGAKFVVRD